MLIALSNSDLRTEVSDDFSIEGTFYLSKGYVRRHSDKALLHRLIMEETDPKVLIDHIDRNKLNNRKDNLRRATTAQNNRNKEHMPSSTLGIKNVHFDNRNNTIRVRIYKNHKCYGLGVFSYSKLEEVITLTDYALIRIHGEFSNTYKSKAEYTKPAKDVKLSILEEREYFIISPKGEVIITDNLRKLCRDNGIPHQRMYEVLHTRRDKYEYKGWTVGYRVLERSVQEYLDRRLGVASKPIDLEPIPW